MMLSKLRPRADTTEPEPTTHASWTQLAERTGPWPQAGAVGTKLFLGAICLGVLSGPVAIALQLATTATTAATAPATTAAPDATAAEAAATRLVHRYLTATQDQAEQLLALVAEPPARLDLPKEPPTAPTWIGVSDVTLTQTGNQAGDRERWRVLVLTADPTGEAAWEVLVDVRAGSAQAVALPARVPLEVLPTRDGSGQQLALSHPAAVAAGGYANASLTGAADLSRWTVPGYEPAPVSPAACASTELSGVVVVDGDEPTVAPAAGEQTRLVVSTTCHQAIPTSPNPGATPDPSSSPAQSASVRTIQMVLTLRGRDGRWEVSPSTEFPNTSPTPTPTP